MVKAITFSIPVYLMQITRISKSMCYTIDKCNWGFIWDDMEQKCKVHLISWKEYCKPKSHGGLGIHSIRQSIITLLSKLG